MPIDFLTCSAQDVIFRSVQLHPSLLADAMHTASLKHSEAALTMIDGEARRIGARMSADAHTLVALIQDGELDSPERIAKLSFGRQIMLLTAACRFQCVPYCTAQDILKRSRIDV